MEFIVVGFVIGFLVCILFMIGEVIISFLAGLFLVMILPFVALFEWIFSDKKVKKDRRDAPTVWRRKR